MGYKKPTNDPESQGARSVVNVGTSATKIVNGNRKRLSILIQNQGTTSLYLGGNNSITTSDFGFSLPGGTANRDGNGDAWSDGGPTDCYEGTVWGIRASGTAPVSVFQVIDQN